MSRRLKDISGKSREKIVPEKGDSTYKAAACGAELWKPQGQKGGQASMVGSRDQPGDEVESCVQGPPDGSLQDTMVAVVRLKLRACRLFPPQ